MPYTLAHPAAVLPLHWLSRGRLRLAALVIGAKTPDFEYFLHLNAEGSFAHSLPGLFVVCLPAGWLGLWLFDRFGRDGLRVLLAPAMDVAPLSRSPSWLWTSLAILARAATHVAWDAFTHANGWGLVVFPVLAQPVPIASIDAPWFKVLQHGSTLLGLTVLSLAGWLWMKRGPRISLGTLLPRALTILAVLAAVGVLNGLRFAGEGLRPFVVAGGVAVTLAAGLGLLALGAWSQARGRRGE